jgi:hypothetical protein
MFERKGKEMKKAVWITFLVLVISVPLFAANGAPSGGHYNLNILGKTTCSGDDLTDSNRHTIQVLLNGGDEASFLNGQLASSINKRNKIYLVQSFDGTFEVLDGNACDSDGARFKLPAPGAYEIYVRALGKPGGSATMTTCATGAGDDLVLGTNDDEIVCSTENVLLARSRGKSSFTNVTQELTTIYADIDGDGDLDRVDIFDADLYDYFWNFENRGLRLAQLRFYPLQ